MRIINQTKNTVIAEEAEKAETLFSRIKGLLGRKELLSGQALVIARCNSIHTFFMRFPIDVLFVDKENRVRKCVSYLKPFRFASEYLHSRFVIELPSGVINSTLTQRADVLSIV
jgi:uncharacterized membrane protein (UPF0127 family)